MTVKMIGPMPQVGYGTWKREGQVAYNGVRLALELGYRHIDTAEGYHNEEFVGKAIADSGLLRDDIFITTKVAPEHFGPGEVIPHARESLRKLKVDQVDLLLVHWPSIKDRYALEAYLPQFAEAKALGLARHIGVSNFTRRHMDRAIEILGAGEILTNQVEIHPLMQNGPIVAHCRALGIPLTAYCPMAQGALAGNPVLAEIAAAHGATVEQVALAFLMGEGHIVIPSSVNRTRAEQNLAAADIALTPAEMARIRGLDAGHRTIDGDWAPVWDAA